MLNSAESNLNRSESNLNIFTNFRKILKGRFQAGYLKFLEPVFESPLKISASVICVYNVLSGFYVAVVIEF